MSKSFWHTSHMNISIPQIQCKRCSHKWTPRKAEVRLCPNCKSAYFDRPKKGTR